MKKIYVVLACTLCSIGAFAQKENVGIGTTKPDQSAVLDINSTSKGLLISRMSLQQRNAIQTPAQGLMVYQSDFLAGFYFYDGKEWKAMASGNEQHSVAGTDGDWALTGNTTATSSNFIGTPSGIPINFKIGGQKVGTLNSGENTFLGYQSGNLVTISGSLDKGNTGFGYRSLASVVPNEASQLGISNVAVGSKALESNSSGSWNLAIGEHALKVNTTGYSNTVVGVRAMAFNISGFRNLAIGGGALRNKTSGSANTGIGVNTLENNLTGSGNIAIGYFAGQNETGSNMLYISNSNSVNPLIKGSFGAPTPSFQQTYLRVNLGATPASPTPSNVGYMAIGDFTTAPGATAGVGGFKVPTTFASGGYRLYVQDGILTEKLKVALRNGADWADYVFDPTYSLMPLEQVESFVKENKHLPNVPSADDLAKEGLDMVKTSAKLMEKIEELTLYMIEMNKEIKALKIENAKLKK